MICETLVNYYKIYMGYCQAIIFVHFVVKPGSVGFTFLLLDKGLETCYCIMKLQMTNHQERMSI